MYTVKIIVKTTLFLVVFSFIYLIFFILPEIIGEKELLKAEKKIYPKYYQLSINRSLQTQYLSLKSESMSFASEKNTLLKKIGESIESAKNEMKTPYKKGLLIFPKRETRLNLEYFHKQDEDLAEQSEVMLSKEASEIEKIIKFNTALADFYAYDMGVDLGGFDVNSDADRELIIERLINANKGLTKAAERLGELGISGTYGKDYKDVVLKIEKLAASFTQMENFVNRGNYPLYSNRLNITINEYEKTRLSTFALELNVFRGNNYLYVLMWEKEIIQKYERVLGKINEMQSGKRI